MTAAIERFDAPLSGAAVVGGALRGMLRAKGGEAVLPPRALQREVVLEAEAVGAYARLCGFAPEQGVPITWPHILAFPLQMRLMLGADFPYPAMGLVHLHNRIRQNARLNIGDRLTLTARAGRFLAHDKGQAFTLETTATRDGATVWEGTSLYLRLGRRGQGDPAPVLSGDEADRLIETWTLPADLGRRYARVSGDANPIHTSALGARLFGFRRAIAHGMWTRRGPWLPCRRPRRWTSPGSRSPFAPRSSCRDRRGSTPDGLATSVISRCVTPPARAPIYGVG